MKKLLSIILAVFMMAIAAPMAFAAGDTVTIDLAKGNVTITETGYSIDGAAEVPFTGDYIITGKNDETKMANVIQINSLAEGSDITLKDVDITQKGPYCIFANTDIDFKATGTVKLTNTVPIFSGVYGKNVIITGDADILVNTGVYLAEVYTMKITCKSLDVTGTGSAPVVYNCSDFNVNAVNDVVINGSIASSNIEITAGGDITINNANTTSPLLQGTTALKSANGDITIDHKGMICTGSAFTTEAEGNVTINANTSSPAITGKTTIKGDNVIMSNDAGAVISSSALDINAKGDVIINANTSSPAITGETTIKGDNVTVSNDAGAVISSSSVLDINATGDIDFSGNTSSAPFVAAKEINLIGDDVTFVNNGIAILISGNSLKVDATGKFTAVGASNSPLIALQSGNTLDITAGSVEIENTQENGMVIAGGCVVVATTGDISIKGNINSTSGIVPANSTATAKNGTVTLQNDGSGFVAPGNLTINAQNIILANPNATYPVTPGGYDLTADENITVTTGFSSPTYNPTGAGESYDFGNNLTITTSAGTTEHTHSYVDVEYNNDATCTADGTKLVKCDCEWAKEKIVTAEGTMLEHKDEDGDYLCDMCKDYEFEEPTPGEGEPDEPDTPDEPAEDTCDRCGLVHTNIFQKLICMLMDLMNRVLDMLIGIFI